MLQHRVKVLKELLETESNYIADLTTIIDGFMAPMMSEMQSRQLFNSRQLEYIFSNIVLIKKHNEVLLARLTAVISSADGATYDCLAGQIFNDPAIKDGFKVYCV